MSSFGKYARGLLVSSAGSGPGLPLFSSVDLLKCWLELLAGSERNALKKVPKLKSCS